MQVPRVVIESSRVAIFAALLALVVLLVSCAGESERSGRTAPAPASGDPHSLSNPEEVLVTHLELDLDVSFETRTISGSVRLDLANVDQGDSLVLDTRDLEIRSVSVDGAASSEFTLEEPTGQEFMGRALTIPLVTSAESVTIEYATSPDAAALQWLDPEQTSSGRAPFLYTQGQAILTRSWIPCQDTPVVRVTYGGTVRVPAGLLALMSAENPTEPTENGVYTFRMPQPIPPYLLALAVGELEFRPLGPHTGVYAEPSVIEAAAAEFGGTEATMDANERLYGPYRWGRYDILVLPPSFPWGGMENPRLTFATPTIIAGDGSLTALIVHELAHSWSGNLVTNATWNDLWLNEGFTVYVERRVSEILHGTDHAGMLWLLGLQDLRGDIERLGPESPDTRLAIQLEGRDPDDGFSDVPYEKGSLFLRALEEATGREAFDGFLRDYFEAFAFRSLTTEEFLGYLRETLPEADRVLAEVDVDAWVRAPGLPESIPTIESDAFRVVDTEFGRWKSGTPPGRLATEGWTPHQWLHFLRALPDEIPARRMKALDDAFGFTASGNSEIHAEWLRHAIASEYAPAMPALEDFLVRQGRRKFLRPLYRELAETPAGLVKARAIYARARPGYHSISRGSIDEILRWEEGQP